MRLFPRVKGLVFRKVLGLDERRGRIRYRNMALGIDGTLVSVRTAMDETLISTVFRWGDAEYFVVKHAEPEEVELALKVADFAKKDARETRKDDERVEEPLRRKRAESILQAA